ncbi:hypothetical protein BLNAU_1194 [Blattamonas nauphoetae]|uniref:Uncharacterized protein n=1 Tax=Blattamonas nauphoetae TaxID=2049346 RepID=A0ABQ9YIN8_9EUKA|nr:hypothetical protein BLNAU_1194 [Blattamonas nauphoetae]
MRDFVALAVRHSRRGRVEQERRRERESEVEIVGIQARRLHSQNVLNVEWHSPPLPSQIPSTHHSTFVHSRFVDARTRLQIEHQRRGDPTNEDNEKDDDGLESIDGSFDTPTLVHFSSSSSFAFSFTFTLASSDGRTANGGECVGFRSPSSHLARLPPIQLAVLYSKLYTLNHCGHTFFVGKQIDSLISSTIQFHPQVTKSFLSFTVASDIFWTVNVNLTTTFPDSVERSSRNDPEKQVNRSLRVLCNSSAIQFVSFLDEGNERVEFDSLEQGRFKCVEGADGNGVGLKLFWLPLSNE